MTRARVNRALALAVLALWAGLGRAPAAEPAGGGEDRAAPGSRVLRIGLWLPAFVNFNPNDARVASQVWVEKWGRKSGLYDGAETRVFEDSSNLGTQIAAEHWDLIMLPVEEFFRVGEPLGLTPDFTVTRGDQPGDVHVLLVRRDSGIAELKNLKGHRILVATEHNQFTGSAWLNDLLARQGLPELATLAEVLEGERKPAKQILPVFFGQADACLVSRYEFAAMVEMNPQVGEKLVVLAESPRLLSLVFCLAASLGADRRAALRASLATVHKDEEFRQLLLLQKVTCLEPPDQISLEATRVLCERRRATAAGAAARPLDREAGHSSPGTPP